MSRLDQLQLDWLDALSLLPRERVPVLELFRRCRFALRNAEASHTLHLAKFEGTREHTKRVTFELNEVLLEWPRIERIEPLVWLAIEAWKFLDQKVTWADAHQLARYVGCDYSNSINPQERWRWIGSFLGSQRKTLPIQVFEDRDQCAWCSTPLITNSRSEQNPEVHRQCEDHMDITFKALMRSAKAGKLEVEDVSG